jgi:glycosyltransferase involved in cell wall biosynthesis
LTLFLSMMRKAHDQGPSPVVIASMLRPEGTTGVQTHARELRRFLEETGSPVILVTPFSWGRMLTYPVFGFRVLLKRSPALSVAWYRRWHEDFLRNALRRRLAGLGDCVIYAQGPLEARAALRARRGPHQRVIMAVHYRVSQADEWCNTASGSIKRDGIVFRGIRRAERATIPRVDGIVYVSDWARQALLTWLTEAAAVPSAVIGNFIMPLDQKAPLPEPSDPERAAEPPRDLVSTGGLDIAKNHRFLLEVLAEASKLGRSLTLDVYGDGPLRRDLLEMTRSLGLEGQVRFRGFRPDVRDFLPGYRMYVHSSYTETSSLAIMEAMCAGLPIVAAPVGGIPELLDDGAEGRFWDLGDPAKAAATLLDLLDDEQAWLAAASAARERFKREFDAGVVVPRLASFLRGTTEPGDPWLVPAGSASFAKPFTIDPRVR